MYGTWLYAFNGILSAGHRIEEDISVAPHTQRLIQALERCEGQMAMTQLQSGLSVKAGRFKAVVPCHVLNDMPPVFPDPPVAVIDDRLRAGMAAVAPLVSDNAQTVITACARLGPQTICATNRHVVIEYWHGIDLPVILVPKTALKAIEGIKKPLTQFGYSGNTATFYFSDGSWLKTQLYADKYPDIGRVLDKPSDQWPVTPGLYDALRVLKPFTEDSKCVMFSRNLLHTSRTNNTEGGSYELEGIPEGRAFNLEYLLMLEGIAKTIDYAKGDSPLLFFGENVRGAVSGMRIPGE